MQVAIIIPVRFGSTRFPGKPLVKISGRSMLERVWLIANAAHSSARIIIATDDQRIYSAAQQLGAEAMLTSSTCRNGSERVLEVLEKLRQTTFNVVVNFQGDAVLTPPWVLADLIKVFELRPNTRIATPALQLDRNSAFKLWDLKKTGSSSGTLVTFDKDHNALYFSKSFIPFIRNAAENGPLQVFRHIGLYAYRPETLKQLCLLPESRLERSEGLEQLRALENQIPIKVVPVDYRGRSHASVDNPEDVGLVEAIISTEGELI